MHELVKHNRVALIARRCLCQFVFGVLFSVAGLAYVWGMATGFARRGLLIGFLGSMGGKLITMIVATPLFGTLGIICATKLFCGPHKLSRYGPIAAVILGGGGGLPALYLTVDRVRGLVGLIVYVSAVVLSCLAGYNIPMLLNKKAEQK